MKRIADIWYVDFADLTALCGISTDTVKQGVSRGLRSWQSTKDPDDNRRRLIRYDTMTDKYKAIVRRVLCGGLEPWEKAAQKKVEVLSERSISELLELTIKEGYKRYCGLYPLTDTSKMAERTQKCLARAAAIIELLGNYVQERELDERSYQPYKEVIAWFSQDKNYEYFFPKGCQYLPLNPIRLKEKVQLRFGKPGVEPLAITQVISLPRKGNKSRDKFMGDAELNAWIAMARMQPTNDTNAYVIRKISEVCRIVGRDVPSRSWFSQVLASTKMKYMTAESRFGSGSKLASRYTHSITMARAMYAGDCWMMDATRVNMIEHVTSKNGKEYDFLFVIAVRDAYSGHVVGVHFDTKEDRWGYTNALKMAVKSTGYLPHTLVYDRFPGHISEEMKSILAQFEYKGVSLVCTHKATGKALLERWFDTLQTVFLAKSRYYYGQGIQSTRDYAHRSPDYLVKMRKEARQTGWDFDHAWREAWQRIEDYGRTPVSFYSRLHKGLDLSPNQLHEQSEKPNVIEVPIWDQAGLFWMTKVLDVRRSRIEQEVHGVKYEYHLYDEQVLYANPRIAIRYEEADPTRIMLFSVGVDDRVSDNFIMELTHTTAIPMYGPDANKSRVAGRTEKIKQFQGRVRADLEKTLNGTSRDPEYLLNLGGRIDKGEFESVQSGIIYEQMGATVAVEAHRPAKERRIKHKVLPPAASSSSGPIDPDKFITDQFFNQ